MAPAVWIDCDPGHDDAMALILAGYGGLDVVGVSTVHGNQSLEKTTVNAARVLAAAAMDVVVVPGAAAPLARPARHDAEIHGEGGLDGSAALDAVVVAADRISGRKAVLAMAEALLAPREGRVTLIATGALTNVALLFALFPEIPPRLERVIIMGGAVGVGNRTAVAEFNILCDPEAARMVFDARVEVVLVPLEVTHSAVATSDVLDRIDAACASSAFGTMVVDLLVFFKKTYADVFRMPDPPVHDACAVYYAVNPAAFRARDMRVDVVTDGLCAGQTVCDVWGYSAAPANVRVCEAMDVGAFWAAFVAACGAANARSPVNGAPPAASAGSR